MPSEKEKKVPADNFVLFGNKVFLRPFTEFDIDVSYISWLNDPEVVRFSNQRFLIHDKISCMRYLASFNRTSNMFVSVRKISDNKQIGTLTAYISSNHGTVDIGILIGDKSVWGQGYGQEAWNLIINWLIQREDIRKITAGTVSCNYRMIKVMENSGMKLEAVRKEHEIIEGKPMDILYFAKFHVD